MTSPNVAGGLRARLIHDNLFEFMVQGLTELGWLEAGRRHAPVTLLPHSLPDDNKIMPNIVTLSTEDVVGQIAEMGNPYLTNDTWKYYADIYADTEEFGKHMGIDIRDLFNGKIQTVSKTGGFIDVYDLANPTSTPVYLFNVEIDKCEWHHARVYEKPWQRHYYVVSFDVLDTSGSNTGNP